MLKLLKDSLGIVVIIGGLLIALGSTLYKVNSIEGLVTDLHAQSERIIVIEQKTKTLESMRTEDLHLLRQDIRDLKDAIVSLDKKVTTILRD